MKRKAALLLAMIFTFISAGSLLCGGSPERIVSLGPAITERIFLLGRGSSLIADTQYCKRPAAAESITKIGSITAVDIEKIVSLQPDLVFAVPLNGKKTVTKLRRLGVRVELFREPESFKDLFEEFLRLAKILDKEDDAGVIIDESLKKLASIKKSVGDKKKPRVFLQLGSDPLFAATGDTFVNDFIEYAGGVNVAEDAKKGIYSREEVLKADPDVILIITMGIVGEQEKEIWKGFDAMKAARSGRIHIIDAYDICSPSPAVLAESVETVKCLLYPGKNHEE
jgi:iron complex transport system substrate-binding protein